MTNAVTAGRLQERTEADVDLDLIGRAVREILFAIGDDPDRRERWAR